MLKIVDNFYDDVDSIRNFALQQEFSVRGNFPGFRTKPYEGVEHTKLKRRMEEIVGKRITFWPGLYNTAFQLTTKKDSTWIHHDGVTTMAGIIYLTPNAPVDAGTSFYQHKSGCHTHSDSEPVNYNEVETPFKEWKETDRVANYYNRLVVYNSRRYHSSSIAGFGNSLKNGRLFQTFFFNAE